MVDINWIAVVLATLSTMVVGSVWYARPVFGRKWQKLIGKSDKELSAIGWWPIPITVAVSFVTSLVLAHLIFLAHTYFGNSWLQDALTTGFWIWLGFIAARFITHDAFEGRRKKLTILTVAHEFVTIMVMATIIGLFPL